jgi:hypothetical protein
MPDVRSMIWSVRRDDDLEKPSKSKYNDTIDDARKVCGGEASASRAWASSVCVLDLSQGLGSTRNQ